MRREPNEKVKCVELSEETIRLFYSEGARVELTQSQDESDGALIQRLEYQLAPKEYAGCIFLPKEKDGGDLPENFQIEFDIRGDDALGRLECKLVTDEGSGCRLKEV